MTLEELKDKLAFQPLMVETVECVVTYLSELYGKAWKSTAPTDKEGRERLYYAVQVTSHVLHHISALAEGKSITDKMVDELKKGKIL